VPDELSDCLGETGEMILEFTQSFVEPHLYTRTGACLSICAKFMCDIAGTKTSTNAAPRPGTRTKYLEFAQWVQERPNRMDRINEAAVVAGLRHNGTLQGQHFTDEIYLSQFVQQSTAVPSFVLFGFLNTLRTRGHAVLLYTRNGSRWNLLDPNFGIASWSHSGGMLLGLKRLLNRVYPDFGPYYRFTADRYQK
jgi:hypothetical protein